MTIMLIMTAVLFSGYPETVKRLNLANFTSTLALSIHEAQVRGSAIDSANSSLGGYGIYINLSNPSKIILFGDIVNPNAPPSPYQITVGNGLYDGASENKTITTLPTGYVVTKLCTGDGFPFVSCNTSGDMTISFTRPNPQPNIYINNVIPSVPAPAGCIELHSPMSTTPNTKGHVRSVQVYSSGIIRTVNTGCK